MLSWGPGLLLCFLVVSVLQMVDLVAYTGSPRDELGHRLKGCQLRAGPEGHFPVAQCPPSGPGSSHCSVPFTAPVGASMRVAWAVSKHPPPAPYLQNIF